jgi:flagellar protein FliS
MAMPVLDIYRKTQVRTAPPSELLLMVYDVAVRSTERAIKCMENGHVAEANRHLLKAQAAVDELNGALDFEVGGRIAQNLASLYDFIKSSLIKANLRKDPDSLKDSLRLLIDLKDGWIKAIDRIK